MKLLLTLLLLVTISACSSDKKNSKNLVTTYNDAEISQILTTVNEAEITMA